MRNEQRRPEIIYIENEGFVPLRSTDRDRAFRFCRMFDRPNPSRHQPETDAIIALGMGMRDSMPPDTGNTSIPSGFVYLAQFVNHDIITDRTQYVPPNQLTPEKTSQGRSPSLNLDSIYGGGPDNSPNLYENDKILFKLRKTTKRARFSIKKEFYNDLPRRPADDPIAPKQAITGNPLNDENLILAQTHVAFLKFHNQIVRHLRDKEVPEEKLFKESRKIAVQHYQSIVLHDLLPRIVIYEAYDNVVNKNHRRLFYSHGIPTGEYPALPVEFALAAFRFGHSMVRNSYEWNDIFHKDGRAKYGAKLSTLFRLSKLGGLYEFS